MMYRDPFWISSLLVRADLVKQVGSFDPHIEYAEDHDLLFRLSLVTSFCYAEKPLCIIDRSKSPQGSLCRPWDQVEARLRGSQLMYEKWVKLDRNCHPKCGKPLYRICGMSTVPGLTGIWSASDMRRLARQYPGQ